MGLVNEYNTLIELQDEKGNVERHYPITKARNVIGAIGETDLSSYVKNTDYATSTKGGIIKVTNRGVAIKNGEIEIIKATEEQIDQKTANYTVIVPSNLDYAVRSVLPAVQTSLPETIIKNCISLIKLGLS